MLYKLQEIFKERKSDTAIFLGSAESINDITPEQWEKISKHDTFALNNWHYHPFVPNFYHVEVKSENRNLWKRRQIQKAKEYKNVKYICSSEINLSAFIDPKMFNVYVYKMINLGYERIPIPKYRLDKKFDPNSLTFAGGVSMSIVFELIYRMKYKKLILLGVDYYNSRYFWSDRPQYGDVHCHHNKDRMGKKENEPHNSAHLIPYIITFGELYVPTYVGYQKTALYPKLPYFPLENL